MKFGNGSCTDVLRSCLVAGSVQILSEYSVQYLKDHWSQTEMQKFVDHIELVLYIIRRFPEVHEYSKESDTHCCVLSKQVSLYYQKNEALQQVELLIFWDNRQDPEKLRF